MGFIVKNTTKWGSLDLVCPHSCRGCGRLGAVLCECCKNNIKLAGRAICPLCKCSVAMTAGKCRDCGAEGGASLGDNGVGRDERGLRRSTGEVGGERESLDCVMGEVGKGWMSSECSTGEVGKEWMCPDCKVPFCWLGVVGWREGALAKVVKDFKYKSVRAAGEVLAELLDFRIPEEFEGLCGVASEGDKGAGEAVDGPVGVEGSGRVEVVVVPLPTMGWHVRERGLDHTAIMAKKLAKRRGWKYERVLGRAVDTVQVGTKAADRKAQAEKAYAVEREVDENKVYLLVDDVWTTGATMLAAEKVLREAGARKIAGVVLAVGR